MTSSTNPAGIGAGAIEEVAARAEREWRRRENPRWRSSKYSVTDDQGAQVRLRIEFYHHETFPMGGQLYTLDVRRADTGQLLHQDRLSLVPLD